MSRVFSLGMLSGLALFTLLPGTNSPVSAQTTALDNSRKEFPLVAPVVATGEELGAQPRLWIMEVHFKPVRMVPVVFTDPKTGRKHTENIWYIVYKAINRKLPFKQDQIPTEELKIQFESDKDQLLELTRPFNDDDVEPVPQMFVPIFTLRTDDLTNGKEVEETYQDVILPEAQAAIQQREGAKYKNSVEIMQIVPDPVAKDAANPEANAIYGMAMWRGVDRETDYFTITMTGFSNAYRYVNSPVSFDVLKSLATVPKETDTEQEKQNRLLSSDSVWHKTKPIRSASEVCGWDKTNQAQLEVLPNWQSAGSVPGLMPDNKKAPPENRNEGVWLFSRTADRYPRDQRPPTWRRAIVQHFSRYGDSVDESEKEFRPCLEPQWRYMPESQAADSPAVPMNAVEPVPAGPSN